MFNIAKLIEKIETVNSPAPVVATVGTDSRLVKLAQFFDEADFGCQEDNVRALTEIIVGAPIPTVIGGSSAPMDDFPAQLACVVITGNGSAYPVGTKLLYVRPVTQRGGKGRGFDPLNPTVRQPVPYNLTRPATPEELQSLLGEIDTSTGHEALAGWFAAGDWKVASLIKLVA